MLEFLVGLLFDLLQIGVVVRQWALKLFFSLLFSPGGTALPAHARRALSLDQIEGAVLLGLYALDVGEGSVSLDRRFLNFRSCDLRHSKLLPATNLASSFAYLLVLEPRSFQHTLIYLHLLLHSPALPNVACRPTLLYFLAFFSVVSFRAAQ